MPMPTERLLQGVYVPLITPFGADGSVALDAVSRLCHEYLDAGCAGIVALGTTGESAALDGDEQPRTIGELPDIGADELAPFDTRTDPIPATVVGG